MKRKPFVMYARYVLASADYKYRWFDVLEERRVVLQLSSNNNSSNLLQRSTSSMFWYMKNFISDFYFVFLLKYMTTSSLSANRYASHSMGLVERQWWGLCFACQRSRRLWFMLCLWNDCSSRGKNTNYDEEPYDDNIVATEHRQLLAVLARLRRRISLFGWKGISWFVWL